MEYSPAQPPGSFRCGSGTLIIRGATGVAGAEALAKLGAREFIYVQINQAVQQALLEDEGLSAQMAAYRNPHISYTLGTPTELSPESWSFPFEAFASGARRAG